MNSIVFYIAGAASLMFVLSALAILLGVSDMERSSMGTAVGIALAFACLAWWAAAGEVAE